jgi:hypothetical protein
MKKFELTTDSIIFCGIKLFRIRALIEFSDVKAGEVGGYIEKEKNLSQLGDAWVSGDAGVSGDADYTTIKGFGKIWRTTTFFREKDRIAVRCGCFYGGLDDFREKVKETYKDNKKGKEYLMIADLMEYHFKKEEE